MTIQLYIDHLTAAINIHALKADPKPGDPPLPPSLTNLLQVVHRTDIAMVRDDVQLREVWDKLRALPHGGFLLFNDIVNCFALRVEAEPGGVARFNAICKGMYSACAAPAPAGRIDVSIPPPDKMPVNAFEHPWLPVFFLWRYLMPVNGYKAAMA